jgi:Family of unknown function (DUF6335)
MVLEMTNPDFNKRNKESEAGQDISLTELGRRHDDTLNDDLNELEDEDGALPQAFEQSYGTGVKEMPGFEGEEGQMYDAHEHNETSAILTGGDVDANYEQAIAVGDESVGGTAPTPDMDVVDELGRAVGLEMDDANFLHTNDILAQRDDRRWEMEPRSSEDYEERRDDLE